MGTDSSVMSEEDLLYGDLDDDKPAAASGKQQTVPYTTGDAPPGSSLVDQVQALQEQVKQLQLENETLKRNMGTLYRTAVAEIKRKDAEIERLQDGQG